MKRKREMFRMEESPSHARSPERASRSRNPSRQPAAAAATPSPHSPHGIAPKDQLISPGYLGSPNKLQQLSSSLSWPFV